MLVNFAIVDSFNDQCLSPLWLRDRLSNSSVFIVRQYWYSKSVRLSLHWLKVNERIEYKLLSLTYKVLTTAQPSYLRNLISLQPPRSTRYSSVVTFSPPTISSLKITDRSFSYASLVFGINFQIHSVSLTILVSIHLLIHFSTHLWHHPHSCHPSLLHSRLKTYLFNKSFPP